MTKTILAIETSCDETAVALIEASGSFEFPQFNVVAHELFSQAEKHAEFGGVYPSLAKREHGKNLVPLLEKVTQQYDQAEESSELNKQQEEKLHVLLERESELYTQLLSRLPHIPKPTIDAIAVTQGPGLEPALWVGINFAKALSFIWDIPLIPINHMEGHIFSVLLEEKEMPHYPLLALLVSGGHTQLVVSKEPLAYDVIGETRDDAIGEAYDKVARMLKLSYPGGPEIALYAQKARDEDVEGFQFPRPMMQTNDFDFSFSGLKTAVLYKLKEEELTLQTILKCARGFEDAVIDVLVHKTQKALEEYRPKSLILGGGVSANKMLQNKLKELVKDTQTKLYIPKLSLSTDNAVMIGMTAYLNMLKKKQLSSHNLKADGNLRLSTPEQ